MAASIALGAGAATAVGAYLNAKYHIAWDLWLASLAPTGRVTTKFVDGQTKAGRLTTFDMLEENARNHGSRTFLIFEGHSWTYQQFYERILKAANWLLHDLDVQKDEVVPMYGINNPEYLVIWFSLECIGAVTSFVNCNLTGQSLLHCVKLCKSRYFLYDIDSKANISTCNDGFRDNNVSTFQYDPDFLNALKLSSSIADEASKRRKGIEPTDLRGLLYTSGTTGLPKAVRMPVLKDLMTGHTIARYLQLKPESRIFTCLPLYHGSAHGLCVTPTIHAGSSVVLSRRFSHKTFWPEVRESKANILQYVGELCRYLVNAPPSPLDKAHSIRMAWGNGMRSDVWEPFRQRFGIDTINELYAATDTFGKGSFNPNRGDFSRHAIGVRGLIWQLAAGRTQKYVKVDMDTQEVLRDDKGWLIECKADEPGEEIYWVDPAIPLDDLYYQNIAAREKRLLHDCFKKGDVWFRSGDLHLLDSQGRVFFADRLGDTFRWRSENVSTNEVADIVGSFPSIAETNVIGVLVPASDGRCGCAAVVLRPDTTVEQVDWKGLAEWCLGRLPRYAVPGFVRVTGVIEYTGTFKIQKGRLRKEGVDPDAVSGGDRIYWLPWGEREYRPFTKEDWEALKKGTARV